MPGIYLYQAHSQEALGCSCVSHQSDGVAQNSQKSIGDEANERASAFVE